MEEVGAARTEVLERIQQGLDLAVEALKPFVPGNIRADQKSGGRGPVTEADRMVGEVLREALVRGGEGWFSEETPDDFERLARRQVWVVDPIDGTRDLVAGVPEWCVSIGLVEDGRAIAGGVLNPSTGERFLGSAETGVLYNGRAARATQRASLEGAVVLASRHEMERGEWARFSHEPFTIKPVGSIAYKLALLSAGLADATWTFSPKHEWDIAGGVALVEAAGGFALTLKGSPIVFNRRSSRLEGLIAAGPGLQEELPRFLRSASHPPRKSDEQM